MRVSLRLAGFRPYRKLPMAKFSYTAPRARVGRDAASMPLHRLA